MKMSPGVWKTFKERFNVSFKESFFNDCCPLLNPEVMSTILDAVLEASGMNDEFFDSLPSGSDEKILSFGVSLQTEMYATFLCSQCDCEHKANMLGNYKRNKVVPILVSDETFYRIMTAREQIEWVQTTEAEILGSIKRFPEFEGMDDGPIIEWALQQGLIKHDAGTYWRLKS